MDDKTPQERIKEKNRLKAEASLQKELDRIRHKTPPELREDEIAFLKARATYLTLDDKEKYASVLEVKKPKKEDA